MLLFTLGARAQFDVSFTNAWALQSYYNPAAAGLDEKLNVQGAYSLQMMGFENAPATMLISADMPLFLLGPRHGVGLSFMKDDAGMFSTKKLQLQYAYHQPLLGGRLSIGVRPTLLMEGFDGSKLDTEDASDPAFAANEITGQAFDLDAGLRFTYKKLWYAGASVQHLMGPTITMGDDKTHELTVDPTFYAQGGYNLYFRDPRYLLALDAMMRTDLQNWRGDISARLLYEGSKHKLYGGVMYSPSNSMGLLLGFDFHGINIGYSYEMYTGGIGALNGTHEILIGYQTDLNLFRKGKNVHKSVRIL